MKLLLVVVEMTLVMVVAVGAALVVAELQVGSWLICRVCENRRRDFDSEGWRDFCGEFVNVP